MMFNAAFPFEYSERIDGTVLLRNVRQALRKSIEDKKPKSILSLLTDVNNNIYEQKLNQVTVVSFTMQKNFYISLENDDNRKGKIYLFLNQIKKKINFNVIFLQLYFLFMYKF